MTRDNTAFASMGCKAFSNILLLNLTPEKCMCDTGEGGPELRHTSKAQTGFQVRCSSQKLCIPIHLQHLSPSQLAEVWGRLAESKAISRAEQTLVTIFFHLPRSHLLQRSHHTQGQPFPLGLKKLHLPLKTWTIILLLEQQTWTGSQNPSPQPKLWCMSFCSSIKGREGKLLSAPQPAFLALCTSSHNKAGKEQMESCQCRGMRRKWSKSKAPDHCRTKELWKGCSSLKWTLRVKQI